MSDRMSSLASRALVVLLFVLYVGPMYVLLATSLKSRDQLGASATDPIFTPTLDAYRQVINDDLFRAIANSFQIALGSTLLILLIVIDIGLLAMLIFEDQRIENRTAD